jgi:hypothetical protein
MTIALITEILLLKKLYVDNLLQHTSLLLVKSNLSVIHFWLTSTP